MEDTNTTEAPEIRDPEALLKAFNQAKKEAQTYRENIEVLKGQLEQAKAHAKELEEGGNPYKDMAIKAQVRLALTEQNVKDHDRILRFLDLNGVDLDEEGNLSGLEDKLTVLKNDLPELFDVKRRAANKADAFAAGDAKVEKSITEQQVDSLFGF